EFRRVLFRSTAKKPTKKAAKASKKSTSKRAAKAAATADVEPAQEQKQSKVDDAAADKQPVEGEQSSSEAPVTPAAEETPAKKTRKRAVRRSEERRVGTKCKNHISTIRLFKV